MKKVILFIGVLLSLIAYSSDFQTVSFETEDGLDITADVYTPHPTSAPFILLFHQAGFSRGEYRSIAPQLNILGFNCMAVDQRSGNTANGVANESAKKAKKMGKGTSYLDTLPDLEAAIAFARKNYVQGQLLTWGSSYSASLVLYLAGTKDSLVDGVLAFAPGEYFRKKKGSTFITDSAQNIEIPVFITSAKDEKKHWWSIFNAIPSKNKAYFLPESSGIHGSRALWSSTQEHREYWQAVEQFLSQFLE